MSSDPLVRLCEIALERHQARDFRSAAEIYSQILEIDPARIDALKGYGILLCQVGDYQSGVELLRHAVAVAPEDAESWSNLGNGLRVLERFDEAVEACERATQLSPTNLFAWNNLSASQRGLGLIGESIASARRALELEPEFADAAINLASGYQAAGQIREALQVLQPLVESLPDHEQLRDNFLFTALYSDELTATQILEFHARDCGVRQPANPDGELKTIGFISGDLRHHPVGQFLEPLLRGLSDFTVIAYANQPADDEQSAVLRRLVSGWRSIYGLAPATVAEMIASDGVDILIDLAGHSALNRLDVLHLRPAPVQATFLGYSGTTGESSVDWIIADETLIPAELEHLYSERVSWMDCPIFNREVKPIPASTAAGETITFGSFNNSAKMSPSCIETWAKILDRLPESRLVLKYKFFESEYVRNLFAGQFQAHGIATDRVEFVGHLPKEEHEALYDTIDVALDPFPYTGATSSFDALARGVPVVTLLGERYVSRMTASLLIELGLEELIAQTPSDYVEKAIEVATSGAGDWRRRISERLQDSRLTSGDAVSASFCRALKEIWASP